MNNLTKRASRLGTILAEIIATILIIGIIAFTVNVIIPEQTEATEIEEVKQPEEKIEIIKEIPKVETTTQQPEKVAVETTKTNVSMPSVKPNSEPINVAEVESEVEAEIEVENVPVSENQPTTQTVETNKNLGTFKISAYCHCSQCCGKSDGITATGTKVTANRTIAVDPRVIPLGSQVMIDGNIYVAEDTGGNIKGNRIDMYFPTHQEALNWGIRYKEASIIY